MATLQTKVSMTEATGALRLAALASIFAIALAAATASPFTIGAHGVAVQAAFAGNGNGNGADNGKGNGNDGAPGQQKQLADDGTSSDDEALSSVAEGVDTEGRDVEQPTVVPIAEDAEPATHKVIKELAGLPDKSALSDEEETDAIRSGWGTWRTADGPETVIAR